MRFLEGLDWVLSPAWIAFAVVALVFILVLAALAWHRSGYRAGAGALELLRVVIACLVLVTLLEPEWSEEVPREERPVLAVLEDASGSMETRDMRAAAGALPISRAEWLRGALGPSFWEPLEESVDVVIEPFSAPGGDRDAGGADAATSAGGTDIHAALESALTRHEELRAIVLVSDGDWNTGPSPIAAATRLRARGVPVFTVPAGRETPLPDIEIAAIEPPTFSVVGKSLQIPFTIHSTLPVDHPARVRLRAGSDEVVEEKEIVLPAMGTLREMFFWTPGAVGDVELTVDVPAHQLEAVTSNNEKSVTVTIREESLAVLVIESRPRWEYRYLRNALERDPGVEVSCLLFHPGLSKIGGGSGYLDGFPATPEDLARFDVVFLGDVGALPGQLSADECTWLRGIVEAQACGLVFLPGIRGHQFSLLGTELRDLYPVALDAATMRGHGSARPRRMLLTRAGRRSLLTKLADEEDENSALWRSLPGFQWRAPVLRSKAGSEVLAVDEESRAPLIVTKTFGTGKILFMGTDGAWRWREGVEDRYHYRFWGQVARWMAYQRHMAEGELLRFFYAPDRPEAGGAMTLHATVLDPAGAPLGDGTVHAAITHEDGAVTRVAMRAARGDWGLYSARFTPALAGNYTVRLECEETAAILETRVRVGGASPERIGKPARFDVLEEIATVSRGEQVAPERVDTLLRKVLDLPEPTPFTRRVQIWANPYWAGFLLLLVTVFWIGRKLRGTV